ncbi:Vesicle-associated membrane protein 1 [Aphelenchoides avenae]|nr:Vesicle-associated membrane protein 1 [Aphelenchus avenae]
MNTGPGGYTAAGYAAPTAQGGGYAPDPSLPPPSANAAPPKRHQQLMTQVNDVVQIMSDNMKKALARDVQLSQLDERATDLEAGAQQFSHGARALSDKMWWKDRKTMAIIGAIVLVLLILIIWAT